jgi:predicted membrane channel-forming protein YqfA (hemolysin III family)
LSTVIFFTELLYIPNMILITSLDTLTGVWNKLLSYGSKDWLIGIPEPHVVLVFLVLGFLLLLFLRTIFNAISKIFFVVLFVFAVYTVAYHIHFYNWPAAITTHTPFKKLIVTQHPDKTIELYDNGFFGKKTSPEKFVSFTLKPYLIKTFGLIKIKNVNITRPSSRSFRAVEELNKTFRIKKIEVSKIKKLSRYGQKSFKSLKRLCKNEGIDLLS